MTKKKIVASVLAATISASSLAVVNAADKVDIDINKTSYQMSIQNKKEISH